MSGPSDLITPRGRAPLIVGLGGTIMPNSTSERVLHALLARCTARGARTLAFSGEALDLAHYRHGCVRTAGAAAMVSALRDADGIVIVSPGYHGTISGMLKNALDYVEDLSTDVRPYFEGRAIGLVAVAAGWQAAGSTLATLRTIAHALRGWPTPLGVTINSRTPTFDERGQVADGRTDAALQVLAGQVTGFGGRHGCDPNGDFEAETVS